MARGGKPQGQCGAVHLSADGPKWTPVQFDPDKAAREAQIAEMFVRAADTFVLNESAPKYSPFAVRRQNHESDLDFAISTSQGEKSLELVEFAPLHEYGPKFENAPRFILSGEKAKLVIALIRKKSTHHGGAGHVLLIYATEHAFKLDPGTIELTRRRLEKDDPPRFERIYYLSPFDEQTGGVWEIFPGEAHMPLAAIPEEQLSNGPLFFPHPAEMVSSGRIPAEPPLITVRDPYRIAEPGTR